jgi:hypothetical protein
LPILRAKKALTGMNAGQVLHIIATDPYGAGWVSRINPDDWGADSVGLLTGDAALREFAEKMEADGFGGC